MAGQEKLTQAAVLEFIQGHRLAVVATASRSGVPEAALVNFAVTPELEIIFETTTAARKFPNLKYNPQADFVIGWENGRTLQCSGLVDEPDGREGERVRGTYLAAFPSTVSHQYWPGNSYFRLRPFWFRLSDYNPPRKVLELELSGRPARIGLGRCWLRALRLRLGHQP
jgi:hypothetical protein